MSPVPAPGSSHTPRWLLPLGVLVAGAFLAGGWFASGRHLVAPLDDTYIHLQYARRLAEGHFFSYADGVGYSSGATSWLWVLLLAPLSLVGLKSASLLAGALALGALFHLAAGVSLARAGVSAGGTRESGETGPALLSKDLLPGRMGLPVAALSALLFFLNGHVAWANLNGMESALFVALMLGALAGLRGWIEEESIPARIGFVACMALLPLARPEGWILLVTAALWQLGRGFVQRTGRHDLFPILLAAIPGLIAVIVHRSLAGSGATNGMILKGLWEQPHLGLLDKVQTFGSHAVAIVVRFFANEQPDALQAAWRGETTRFYLPPGAAAAAIIGVGFSLVGDFRRGRPSVLSLAALWWICGTASVAASWLPFIHNQRYLATWTPLALLLATSALARIARLFDPHERSVFIGVGGFWALSSLFGLLTWVPEYGRNAYEIFHQHRRMSWIVAEKAAPGDRIATTDAGVVAYFSGRPVDDWVGLCAPAEQARAFASGEGSVFEAIASRPALLQPRWVVTYPAWWSKGFPLGEPAEVAALDRATITAGTDLTLYEAPTADALDRHWVSAEAVEPDAKWEIVDEVNVAALPGEAAHAYRGWHAPGFRWPDLRAWPRPGNFLSQSPFPPPATAAQAIIDPAEIDHGTHGQSPEANDSASTVPLELMRFEEIDTATSPTIAATAPPPAPSPTEADSPTPTATPKPTRTPKPTPTKKPKVSPTPTPKKPKAETGVSPTPSPSPTPAAAKTHDGATAGHDTLDVHEAEGPIFTGIRYDGGRAWSGGEEFELTVRPGQQARLWWRTDEPTTQSLTVYLHGKQIARPTVPAAAPGHWTEVAFPIPASALTSPKAQFRVTFDQPAGAPPSPVRSLRWWVSQPRTN